MPYITDQKNNAGLYVSTTFVWDMQQLATIDLNSSEFRDLLVRIYQNLNNVVLSLNLKDSGYYVEQEFVNGQQFFNPATNDPLQTRSCFRLTVNTGALAAGVNTAAHGLTPTTAWQFTRIYGAATDTAGGNYYPLPFASAGGAANIELRVDNTNIVITNNSGVTFDKSVVVLEYLKN